MVRNCFFAANFLQEYEKVFEGSLFGSFGVVAVVDSVAAAAVVVDVVAAAAVVCW